MQQAPPNPKIAASAAVPPERWLALVDAIEKLSSAQSLKDVVATVRETARAVSGADGVTFVMRDGADCHYIDENAVGPLWKGRRFPLSVCISGWCMLNGKVAAIPDIYADPRIPHDAYRPTFVQSLVMVPVRVSEPIAAIGSYWRVQRQFDEAELSLLEALARATSVAIATVQMRATLHESEERLSMALAAGDLGAWELEPSAQTLITTPLCRAAFGRDDGSLFRFADLIAAIEPEDRARAEAVFARAIATLGDLALECAVRWPDGSLHWIELRGRATRGGGRLAGVVCDITAERLAKERMGKLQSDLAHAGRLAELGQMVSAFGHEIRQPLTAGANYLAAALNYLEGDGTDPGALNAIEKARGQFQRAAKIIDRIRGFARKEQAESSAEDVGAMIAEAYELALMDPRHRGVAVQMQVAAGLPAVLVDKVGVQQVLLNLLRNAFEATEGCAERRVRIAAVGGGAFVEISLADTGPGIAPEIVDQLFKAFVTTKAAGMGIGLSICRGIIESQGGKLWVESVPGKGAVFRLTVPVAG